MRMKKHLWLLLFLFLSSLCINAQVTSDKRITAKFKNEQLTTVFKRLGKLSGYKILYVSDDVKSMTYTGTITNKTIREALDVVLEGKNLEYTIDNEFITIAAKHQTKQAKTVNVSGIVHDSELQEPISGATVKVIGTSIVALTDLEGRFTLKDVPCSSKLEFSYLGMKKQVLKPKNSMHIYMEADVNTISEVVVTGIVNKMRDSFTGSASTFNTDQLKSVGTQNVIASLKTLDPSFNVLDSEYGSDPNHLPDIEIRGKSSLISQRDELAEDPNLPLFILDGFESSLETVYNLDINRIASVTILKDAASTAIYGSKAANGVVVVETIQPKSGKLHLSYNGSATVSWADLTSYNLMNSAEKLEFERLVGRYSNFNSTEEEIELQQSYYDKLADITRGVDTYWLSEPLQTGLNHRHSLYADGGEGAFKFGLGLSYNGINGVMKESVRDNISGNIDLTYRVNKLQFTNKFYLENTDSENPIVSFSSYALANPYYTKYNEEGEVEKWLEYNDYIKASNPLYNAAQNSYSKSGGFSVSDKFIMEYMPIEAMKFRLRFGITHSSSEAKSFRSPNDTQFTNTDFTERGSYSWNEVKSNKYEAEFTFNYGKVLSKVHKFNIAVGGYLSQLDTKSNGYSAIGFPAGDFTLPSFANSYPEGGSPSYYETTTRSLSTYAIGNYAYDDRYLFDFSYRVNGSSVFGTNKHYIGTWAVGVAWNLHREKFIKDNIDGISMLKIRASIGNPGNQNFSSSSTITTFKYNFNMFNYFGMTTSLAQLGNSDLKWQTTIDRNVGFDITILDNRLTLIGDFYYKTTDPLLIAIDMPASSGATNNLIYKNFGKQTSKGFTAQANYYIIRKTSQRFYWQVRGSLRSQSNKLSGIGNQLESFNTKEREGDDSGNRSTKRYYDGADPDDIWAVRSAGIDPATGRELFIKKNGELTYDFSYDDEVIVAKGRPKIEGVLGSSLSYKGFSLNLDFRYRMGGYAFNSVLFNKVENISTSSLIYNQDKRALYDRWQKPGDKAQFKNIANSTSTPMSSRFVQKDNSFSLESARIGYEFSPEVASLLGLGSLRINAYMNDIFRLTTIKMERGTSYPYARSVSFALSATF